MNRGVVTMPRASVFVTRFPSFRQVYAIMPDSGFVAEVKRGRLLSVNALVCVPLVSPPYGAVEFASDLVD